MTVHNAVKHAGCDLVKAQKMTDHVCFVYHERPTVSDACLTMSDTNVVSRAYEDQDGDGGVPCGQEQARSREGAAQE